MSENSDNSDFRQLLAKVLAGAPPGVILVLAYVDETGTQIMGRGNPYTQYGLLTFAAKGLENKLMEEKTKEILERR